MLQTMLQERQTRGTHVHHMCEDYLNNDFDEEKHKKKFLPYALFNQLRKSVIAKNR